MRVQPRSSRAAVKVGRAVILGLALAAVSLAGFRAVCAQETARPVRRHLTRATSTPTPTQTPTIAPTPTPTQTPTITPTPTQTPTSPPRFGELCFTSIRDNRYYDISLMDVASGTVRRITRQSSMVMACDWSHDGSRLAVMSERDGNFEIYSIAADGSDWRRITNSSGDDYGPEWSPDGRHIAYAEDVGGGTLQIFLADPDGSNRVQLTSGAAGGSAPVWSPDGKRIAFVSGTTIKIMGSDGSNPVPVVSGSADKLPTDWSPDGTHILFMSKESGIFKLFTLRLADGVIESVPTGDYDAWDGCWSPDGSLIAFYSYGPGSQGFSTGMFAVFLMNADGSNMRQLTTRTANDRSWHPTWGP